MDGFDEWLTGGNPHSEEIYVICPVCETEDNIVWHEEYGVGEFIPSTCDVCDHEWTEGDEVR